MDASRIRGLLPADDVTMLDEPQEWITGIASIRGHNFPVVDLRGKLGIARGSHGRTPCIVVVEVAGPRLVGFYADRVSEVLNLRMLDLTSGTVRLTGRTRRVLDPDRILTDQVVLNL